MIGKDKIIRLLNDSISHSKADHTQALYIGTDNGLTRYANSFIHQNVAEIDSRVIFQVALGQKIGVASTNVLEKDSLRRCLDDAMEIAQWAKPNPYFKGLAKPSKIARINTFHEPTSKISPAKRAAAVKKICNRAIKQGFIASGALSTSGSEIAIVNSNGVKLYQPLSSSSINIIMSSDNSSGYAQGVSRRFDKIDFDCLTDIAIDKCILSEKPVELEPGKYDVILEPVATANLLEWLLFIAFGAIAYHEKSSFLSGKKGKKIMSPMVSLYDDGLEAKGISFPFDFEGTPKKKVYFVKKGIAGGPVYDLASAVKNKTKSTGHGLPPGGSQGPFPLNLYMAPGKSRFEDMVKSMKRGILVTRFHYINGFLDTPRALLTGMTRDGTFLIENGKLVGGVKNLRFTESVVAAFSNVKSISKETELVPSWWSDIGCTSAPAVYIEKFNFSGKTDF